MIYHRLPVLEVFKFSSLWLCFPIIDPLSVIKMLQATVPKETMEAFDSIKKTKKNRYAIFKADDGKVVVTKTGERDANFEAFNADIQAAAPAYAVFDFEWKMDDGSNRDKLVFVTYIPDTAKPKEKLLYAATKETFKNNIEGGLIEVQGTDPSEISYDAVLAKAKTGR